MYNVTLTRNMIYQLTIDNILTATSHGLAVSGTPASAFPSLVTSLHRQKERSSDVPGPGCDPAGTSDHRRSPTRRKEGGAGTEGQL